MSSEREIQWIGEWRNSRPGEWETGFLSAELEGEELVLIDSSGSYNEITRIPLAVIDDLRASRAER